MRLLPESSRSPERESGPTLCSVLHRKGFVLRSGLHRTRWALTPPFHPYPAKAGRYIFCDTFRQLELASELPALSYGMLLSWCSDFPLLTFWGAAAIACPLDYFRLSSIFRKSSSGRGFSAGSATASAEPSTGIKSRSLARQELV